MVQSELPWGLSQCSAPDRAAAARTVLLELIYKFMCMEDRTRLLRLLNWLVVLHDRLLSGPRLHLANGRAILLFTTSGRTSGARSVRKEPTSRRRSRRARTTAVSSVAAFRPSNSSRCSPSARRGVIHTTAMTCRTAGTRRKRMRVRRAICQHGCSHEPPFGSCALLMNSRKLVASERPPGHPYSSQLLNPRLLDPSRPGVHPDILTSVTLLSRCRRCRRRCRRRRRRCRRLRL